MRAERAIVRLALLALVAAYGCGGGSSSSGGGGGATPTPGGATPTPRGGGGMGGGIQWPQRGGGTSNQVPPSVQIGRVVFETHGSQGGSCCVAVTPSILSGGAAQGLTVLTDLPVGPATVTIAGFSTSFAPAPPGILLTCKTTPPDIAIQCDTMQLATPVFESPPLDVTIVGGAQTNIGSVPMDAFPFLYAFSPGQDADAPAPVQFALTPADAVTGIQQSSVALEVSFTVPDPTPSSSFHTMTKRVPLSLVPCADKTDNPCSTGGNQNLEGFKATGTAPQLPEGPANAHFTASNLADPPADLDFTWPFNVLATPTETGTPAPTAVPTSGAADRATGSSAGSAASASGGAAAGDQSAPASEPTARPATGGAAAGVTPTATPTAEVAP